MSEAFDIYQGRGHNFIMVVSFCNYPQCACARVTEVDFSVYSVYLSVCLSPSDFEDSIVLIFETGIDVKPFIKKIDAILEGKKNRSNFILQEHSVCGYHPTTQVSDT